MAYESNGSVYFDTAKFRCGGGSRGGSRQQAAVHFQILNVFGGNFTIIIGLLTVVQLLVGCFHSAALQGFFSS